MKHLLVVSDLHPGSVFGLLPPDFRTSDGKILPMNPGQEHLWKCWEHFIRWVSGHSVSAVVVNGDVVDGQQDKQKGTELALPVLSDQRRAAEAILAPLKSAIDPAAPWYFIAGTEYHEGKGAEQAEGVAHAMGAKIYTGHGIGHYCKFSLDLNVDGVICNFAHGTSVATGFYRATPADREGIWSALAGKEGKLPKADLVVRAHAHCFVEVGHPSKRIVIGPCWQLQTRHMAKNSIYRMLPDLGAVIYHIDPEAKWDGRNPVFVDHRHYPLPPIIPEILGEEIEHCGDDDQLENVPVVPEAYD